MQGKIIIDFKRIAGKKVDDRLLKDNPKLAEATERTLQILCFQIKKYFSDHKIKVGVRGHLDGG